MKVAGLKSAQKATRWLRGRLVNGALILGYHRIADPIDDAFNLCVQPDHFDQHLAVLCEYAKPISLQALIDDIREQSVRPGTVVITFDDGYLDNLTNALPILTRYGVPATFFITTGFLGKTFWWDELAMLLTRKDLPDSDLRFKAEGLFGSWNVDPDLFSAESDDPKKLLRKLYRFMNRLDQDERDNVLNQIRNWASTEPNTQGAFSTRAMTREELQRLAGNPLAMVGAHSVSHPWFPSLSYDRQHFEINRSKQDLEELLDRPVDTFSYPNGQGNDVTGRLLQQAGFSGACVSSEDLAYAGTDLLRLPRFWMQDSDSTAFAEWLRRWLNV